MAAGDKLLLDSDLTDYLLLDSDLTDVLLLEAAALANSSEIPVGAITLVGQAPQAVTTEAASQVAAMPAGAITLTGLAPQIVVPNTAQMPAGALNLLGRAPTVNDGSVVPVPYDVGWKGGGRVMREGDLPKWWKDEEEPQPAPESPEKSSKERIAELAAGLPIPKAPAPESNVVSIKPKEQAPVRPRLVGHAPTVIVTETPDIMAQILKTEKKILATLLLLLEKD